MPPNKGERTKRLQLLLSRDELSAIEDFRFHARMPSSGCCGSRINTARDGFGEERSVATTKVTTRLIAA